MFDFWVHDYGIRNTEIGIGMEGFLSMNIDFAVGIHRLTIMIMIMINLITYVQNEIL
jgi:hypothetical protein